MNITDTLLQFIADDLLMGLHTEELTAETELLLSGLLDSLGIMRLMLFIEETFQLRVPPEDVTIEHMRSVSTLTNYLQTRMEISHTAEVGG